MNDQGKEEDSPWEKRRKMRNQKVSCWDVPKINTRENFWLFYSSVRPSSFWWSRSVQSLLYSARRLSRGGGGRYCHEGSSKAEIGQLNLWKRLSVSIVQTSFVLSSSWLVTRQHVLKERCLLSYLCASLRLRATSDHHTDQTRRDGIEFVCHN